MTIAEQFRAEGREKAKRVIAERLLAEGMEVDYVAKVTQLPVETVQKLHKNFHRNGYDSE